MHAIERHAWAVFATLSVILVVFGLGDIAQGGDTYRSGEAVLFQAMTGMNWDQLVASDPAAARLLDSNVRGLGAVLLVFGLLSLAASVIPLRRGERWAWGAMWVWPLWLILIYPLYFIAKPDLTVGIPVPLISGTIFLVITVTTLVLSYRRYARPAA